MADPLTPSLPSATAAFERRLQRWAPALSTIDRPVANAFVNFQQQRVARGQQPYSDVETALALRAALTGGAQAAPERDTSIRAIPGNILRNAREITTSLPRLLVPNRGNPLWQELEALGTLPQAIPRALAEGQNIGEDIARLSELPGIRMIPGSYVAGNLAEGDTGELTGNPLMAALDVLPFASKAAKATPVYRARAAAQEADTLARVSTSLEQRFMGETVTPAAVPTLRKPGPLRTVATRRLDDQGRVVPNRLGEVTDTLSAAIGRTSLGQLGGKFGFGQAGREARAVMRAANEANQQVSYVLGQVRSGNTEALRGVVKDEHLAQVVDEGARLFQEHPILRDNEDLGRRMEAGDWSSFTPEERAAADAVAEFNRSTARYLERTTGEIVTIGDTASTQVMTPWAYELMNGEVLPRKQWNRLRAVDKARVKAWEDLQRYETQMRNAKLTVLGQGDEAAAARAYFRETFGVELSDAPIPATRQLIDNLDVARLPQPAKVVAQEYRQAINSFARTDSPRVLLQHAAIARRMLGRMSRNPAFDKELVLTARRELTEATRDLYRAYRNGPLRTAAKRLDRADAKLSKVLAEVMPARWSPSVFSEFEKGVRALADDLTPEQRALVNDALESRSYGTLDSLGFDPADLERVWKDAQPTWLVAKEAAVKAGEPGPVFLHHVGLDEARKLGYARVGERVVTPSQVKERTRDQRPYHASPSIAVTGTVKDVLEAQASRELHETITSQFGTPTSQLRQRLLQSGVAPSEIDWVIAETTVEWNPESVFKGRKVRNVPGSRSDPVRVPKLLDQVMRDMHTQSAVGAVFDPVMRLFRTSVLALSPRYQVYNVIGGGAMVLATNPAAFRKAMAAYRKVGPWHETVRHAWNLSDDTFASTVPRGAPATRAGMGGIVSEGLIREPVTSPRRILAARSHAAGKTMNRVMEQVNRYKEANGGKGWFGKGVDASYASNQWWDDFYRTMVSIDAYETAVKAGKGVQEAELAAVQAVRGVMQNWDELLPIERQILRSVFPFYNWARFSLGFVMRYPFDHPVRTAVVSQFARNEINDMGTGLPETFLGLFQLGGLDENGNARFLRLSGANPFRDVTDWFTLDGLAGNTNPVIAATLQALGYDPQRGGPDLYPELEFDPETGGLRAKSPSFLGALAQSVVPQTQLVRSLIGANKEFNDLIQRDPRAAGQQLMSGFGLPILLQTKNVPEAYFRAERNRYQAFNEARQEAIRTGNLEALERYPQDLPVSAQGPVTSQGGPLGAYLAQLRALDATGALETYRAPQQRPSNVASLLTALGGL